MLFAFVFPVILCRRGIFIGSARLKLYSLLPGHLLRCGTGFKNANSDFKKVVAALVKLPVYMARRLDTTVRHWGILLSQCIWFLDNSNLHQVMPFCNCAQLILRYPLCSCWPVAPVSASVSEQARERRPLQAHPDKL